MACWHQWALRVGGYRNTYPDSNENGHHKREGQRARWAVGVVLRGIRNLGPVASYSSVIVVVLPQWQSSGGGGRSRVAVVGDVDTNDVGPVTSGGVR